MTIKEEMKGTDAEESHPLIGKAFADAIANMEPTSKKKRGRPKNNKAIETIGLPENPIITFTEVRKYIKDLDFRQNSNYDNYISRADIIRKAEWNDAPEKIINLLLKLEDKHYYYYYEIQEAFNKIQQQQTELPAPTLLEKIKEELDQQKEVCNSKESRISHLESHLAFWRMVGWGTGYLFLVLIPIFLAYLQLWITIASDSRYNLLNFDLRQSATGWLSSDASFFLEIIMVVFYIITYGFLAFLWYICWHEE